MQKIYGNNLMGLRIALFSDAFASLRPLGLGRYATELLLELRRQRHVDYVVPVCAVGNPGDSHQMVLHDELGLITLKGSRKWIALRWFLFNRPLLEHTLPPVDLVHCAETDYAIATRKPWAVTVHDIGPLSHPEYFSRSHPWLMARALRRAADRAAAIICISHATAQEVVEFLGRDDLPITVIPHGTPRIFLQPPDLRRLENVENLPPPETPFFIFAGSLNPRKNMLRVIDAFDIASEKIPHHLLIVGDVGWDFASTFNHIKKSSVKGRIHRIGFVDDETLAALYSRATALLYPSLFEGFGFPILEAMACGCPVITSNISSMPEVAGEAALLVDPTNVEAIADAMLRIATGQSTRDELVARGRENVRHFTWERCGKAVLDIYQNVCSGERSKEITLS